MVGFGPEVEEGRAVGLLEAFARLGSACSSNHEVMAQKWIQIEKFDFFLSRILPDHTERSLFLSVKMSKSI